MSVFLITIDTEGDNLWSKPSDITTANAGYLPRFQALCEKFGFVPTYLTNYEMASDPSFIKWASELGQRGLAEIGMHLHAWHSPPEFELTENDYFYHPYLTEYPNEVIRQKVLFMTDLIEKNFGVRPVSHRAGRYGFDSKVALAIAEAGYKVDCSVVPGLSFSGQMGAPTGTGGPNFRDCPRTPYFLDLSDMRKPGDSDLLEIPVTVRSRFPRLVAYSSKSYVTRGIVNRLGGACWLRPNGRNLRQMLKLVDRSVEENCPCIEFMLHSSEFMPGGSPTFNSVDAVDRLYSHLEVLFSRIQKDFVGMSCANYYDHFKGQTRNLAQN